MGRPDRSAKVWKQGRRWHWTLIVDHGTNLIRVYNGHEETWKLAMVMVEAAYHEHMLHHGLFGTPKIVLTRNNPVDINKLIA